MGPKEHIKDWLSTQDRPNTLKDLMHKTLRYDAHKYKRFQEKHSTPNAPSTMTNPQWASSFPAPISVPLGPRPAPNLPRQDPQLTTP